MLVICGSYGSPLERRSVRIPWLCCRYWRETMDSSNSSVDAALDEAKEDSQRTTTTDSSLGQTDSSHEDLHPLPSRKASSTASPASSSASSTMTTRGGGLPSGRPPTRSATVSSATPSKPEDIRTDTHHASPLQRAHTTGIPRPSMSRPWLSGSYDSKSASTLLDSEAAALLSTKGSGSVLTFASQKRDAEFHELFPLLEKSEFLVEGVSIHVVYVILSHTHTHM